MKTIRSLTTILGLSLALFALGAIGARGQALDFAQFVGKFTLPIAAQWAGISLPAGDYTLRYATLKGGPAFVEVQGTAKVSPHVVIHVSGSDQTSARKNALVCIRTGDSLIIRAVEMPAIGEAVTFALPRGAKLTAHHGGNSTNTQLAEARMLIQRVAITLNGK
jgi:hypothetical protein